MPPRTHVQGQAVSAAEYHADLGSPVPSLSSSIAKLLITRSPKHAWLEHPRLNPKYRRVDDSRLDLGSYAHKVLLEGNEDGVTVINPIDYPGKKGGIPDGWTNDAIREARDTAYAEGKLPILSRDVLRVREMVAVTQKAVAENPDLAGYSLSDGMPEHIVRWHEGDTHLRAMLDSVSADRRLIYDYKSTTNAEPEAFLRLMFQMNYDLQGAFYLRANQRPDTKMIFIAQEIEPPYAVSFIGMPPAMVELGTRKVERAIAIWNACMASGQWPAYSNRVLWPEVPAYVMARWDEQEMEDELHL